MKYVPQIISLIGGISWKLEEHRQANRPLLVAFPDFKHEINRMVAAEDRIVLPVTMTGIQKGEYTGILPAGSQMNHTGMIDGRLSEGELPELRGDGDRHTLIQQLGMVMKPGEGKRLLIIKQALELTAPALRPNF